MPQFDSSFFSSQLIWLAIIFTSLYFLISKFIAPKIESILINRDQLLDQNISLAREYKDQAALIELQKQEKLLQVNEEVSAMQMMAEKNLSTHFDKQQAELAIILADKQQQSVDEINHYIDNFHFKEQKHSIRLAGFIIEKITGKEANLTILDQIISKER